MSIPTFVQMTVLLKVTMITKVVVITKVALITKVAMIKKMATVMGNRCRKMAKARVQNLQAFWGGYDSI